MKKKEQFVHCLAEKMLTYALGRGLENYDASCTGPDLAGRFRWTIQVLRARNRDCGE